ncbi:hypothetical protein DYB26_006967 [Aphanomyces astaci]|uniref:D-serine dehydratase-like domain-containing protein n=1 Tax=Aphanomyces astaci TaxID=112090 RepID=A0A3R7EV31_APHAT|nr:hypothetical protein DYB26_006967 [Aphanomyces astaci]
MSTSWVDTPAVVVDEARLQRNIDLMQERASKHNVNLRPHAKTHKSIDIAKMVLAAGAVGVTVSKPLEARKFIEAGFRDITLAYPVVVEEKLNLTIRAAKEYGTTFNLTVESVVGVKVAASSAAKNDYVLNVLIHVDVGYHRVGVEVENDPRLAELVALIQGSPSLKLIGILSHAGHSYGAKSREQCEEIGEVERQIMLRVKATIEKLRPGNYVFQDRTPVRAGVSTVQNVSLTVVATVVSTNAHYFIIDAGSKVLSADTARGSGDFGSNGYGLVFREHEFDEVTTEPTDFEWTLPSGDRSVCFEVKKLSEEHGWVAHAPAGPATSPQVGDLVTVLVNHSCPVVNLCNRLSVKTKDGSFPKYIDLISRGCCQ